MLVVIVIMDSSVVDSSVMNSSIADSGVMDSSIMHSIVIIMSQIRRSLGISFQFIVIMCPVKDGNKVLIIRGENTRIDKIKWG